MRAVFETLHQRRDNNASPLGVSGHKASLSYKLHLVSIRFCLDFLDFHMSLTSPDIERIAHLARLGLSNDQSERMLTKLNDFFAIVEAMRAVDTTGVEPLAHPIAVIQDVQLRLRDDVVSEPNQREANQRSAPMVEEGLFLVPKVIE